MKWKRCKTGNKEYSTLSIGVRHYISMSGEENNTLYGYVYSKNGEQIKYGCFHANNWDEAEQMAIEKIKEELSWQVERWCRLWRDFNEGVNANEALD